LGKFPIVEASDYFNLKPIDQTTHIMKGSSMLYEVAIIERPVDGKAERIVQDVVRILANSQDSAKIQAMSTIDLKTVDPDRLEVIARPFKA
jgi:hypothetical protein